MSDCEDVKESLTNCITGLEMLLADNKDYRIQLHAHKRALQEDSEFIHELNTDLEQCKNEVEYLRSELANKENNNKNIVNTASNILEEIRKYARGLSEDDKREAEKMYYSLSTKSKYKQKH
jgi:chromosome segregation ATPase